VTPLYPQKLALTSPTGGGRSVGIVRSRTKATEYYRLWCAVLGCWLSGVRCRQQAMRLGRGMLHE